MAKLRLDTLLAERGLFPSRSRAAASVMAGEVKVGRGARRAEKPGEMVDAEELILLEEGDRYASRGGVKLANALDSSGVEVQGRTALDVGASTGGFTDCLLQRGAAEVIAVDVGYGTLDYRLRNDPRVTVLERTNARELTPAIIAKARGTGAAARGGADVGAEAAEQGVPDLAVMDVSFISLTKVLAPVIACLAPGWEALAMIKPQFEVGRERVGKGGVVRDPDHRRDALIDVGRSAIELDAAVLGYHSSGLPGPKGNRETFIHLADPAEADLGAGGATGATRDPADLEAMAREVEP